MSIVKPIPDGYHSVTPYLTQKSTDAAIKFYERAFGATEVMRLSTPASRMPKSRLATHAS